MPRSKRGVTCVGCPSTPVVRGRARLPRTRRGAPAESPRPTAWLRHNYRRQASGSLRRTLRRQRQKRGPSPRAHFSSCDPALRGALKVVAPAVSHADRMEVRPVRRLGATAPCRVDNWQPGTQCDCSDRSMSRLEVSSMGPARSRSGSRKYAVAWLGRRTNLRFRHTAQAPRIDLLVKLNLRPLLDHDWLDLRRFYPTVPGVARTRR